ncbi:cellulose synthase complex periplasmic endoglucanase BcsZ [Cupriavidus sp. WGtm5]|uniref:cellulose synthase complex periplasmic endoglucanase BcsZ n=1 Tax=Cupriavidus sp. WGtm5 TaxID=2919926 RepID=UPI002090D13B|nr:cellulose synthase complex periplasmic endoglucanase BcsZ [Cupriavidus sp. WGtm5]MCO4891300.1 cellulose synthase complex periplasmic endoglucanase BcsZ [Cupriavidus sp. WGtm5]
MTNPARRRYVTYACALGASALTAAWPTETRALAPSVTPPASPWPLYRQFLERFVQADGRVIDFSTRTLQSTSEGQSYGMMFALVADDRDTFDRLWRWSVAHLGDGRLDDKLPAWQWGRRDDGTWGVLDRNPAADADLWFAFALAEAARLWHAPAYADAARALLRLVAAQEVATLPGFGPMLLPGPAGFIDSGPDGSRSWRLNPSYLPVPLMRRLAAFDPPGPWGGLAAQAARLIRAVSRAGIVPDWSAYRAGARRRGFVRDPVKGDLSSYDAVRVYLWAGMTPEQDSTRGAMMQALLPNAARLAGRAAPPEKMYAESGKVEGIGPPAFSAALLPFLNAADSPALAAQWARAREIVGAPSGPGGPTYYDTVLGLFGLGFMEGRYRFSASGHLDR